MATDWREAEIFRLQAEYDEAADKLFTDARARVSEIVEAALGKGSKAAREIEKGVLADLTAAIEKLQKEHAARLGRLMFDA